MIASNRFRPQDEFRTVQGEYLDGYSLVDGDSADDGVSRLPCAGCDINLATDGVLCGKCSLAAAAFREWMVRNPGIAADRDSQLVELKKLAFGDGEPVTATCANCYDDFVFYPARKGRPRLYCGVCAIEVRRDRDRVAKAGARLHAEPRELETRDCECGRPFPKPARGAWGFRCAVCRRKNELDYMAASGRL